MKRTLLITFVLAIAFPVIGDMIGYNRVISFKVESAKYTFKHYHNWSESTREKRWKMISSNQNPFTTSNNYSYLECKKKASGETVFKTPTSAFTHIYVDKSEKYIVCLSNIKLWNPYQCVILDLEGNILNKLNTDSIRNLSKNTSESVSNWIYWYDETKSNVEFYYFKESKKLAYIKIRDKKGDLMKIKARNKT